MTKDDLKNKKIGVLYGGLSAEREVSLKSGAAVHGALQDQGYNAVTIDVGRDLAKALERERIEVAFICLHGRYGEDGAVQGLLELMGIPYTGSGVLASALAMNKIFAKQVFAASGLTVASYRVLRRGEELELAGLDFGFPLVVKPSQEGSSVGVSIVKQVESLPAAFAEAFRYDEEILVEQFIKGREIQVGILDDHAMGAIEIVPKNEFYDFEAKYTEGMAEHICPPVLPPELYLRLLAQGEAAHRALGCSGYSRVDFLVTEAGECYLLEVNTLPGMTALSLLPEIAQKEAGIGFGELVERIACGAAQKING
ncbi:D-alanine--D-alanine ligase [Geomobilimonas luticola]|uniref:D-alanine--D-alanine ligase n=1 Tax=Geomobilimonas luticola TaxID=1114878 RepID=A0ABS5SF59_9BACT|nr:D-alanine--D-alanine ligase [Geomobilimonas luticola]MBT0653312.1 D-alanine--D-alanine ligase [Geomobilimonas luticola]